MGENQKWAIGNVIKSVRIEQGIKQLQLCRGICSVATLSRIEAGERDMDYLLTIMLFQRLGYRADKYEFYGSKEEMEQWEQRCDMEQYRHDGNYKALEAELGQYQERWEHVIKGNLLQIQYMSFIEGVVSGWKGQREKERILLEQAISLTVPKWRDGWDREMVVGEIELDILDSLSDVLEREGMKDDAYEIRKSILNYFELKRERKSEMVQRYMGTLCKITAYLYEKEMFRKGLELCENGLQILSDQNRVCYWPDLLFWKGKILEAIERDGYVESQKIVDTYKRCYYAYRLFDNQTMAEDVRRHLEEVYQWECIT